MRKVELTSVWAYITKGLSVFYLNMLGGSFPQLLTIVKSRCTVPYYFLFDT